MLISNELTIDAPVERVWALTVDVENLPTLTPTMTEVHKLDNGPLAVGSRARIKQPGQSARVWTVTDLVPNSRFFWRTKAFGMSMTGGHTLTATDDGGCRNVLSVALTGFGSGLLGRMIGGQLRKAIATENEGFRKAAESVAH